MKTILFLHNCSEYTCRYLFPLRLSEKFLRDSGYRIEFASFDKMISHAEADWIIILHDCLESVEPVIRQSVLIDCRSRCKTLVWLDTSDSTGTTVFDVLPFVDIYLKKQLLRDYDLYQSQYYNLRCYSDYYHRTFGVDDEIVVTRTVLDPIYVHKLRVAWNILVGDVYGNGCHHQNYVFTNPRLNRKYHVSFRGSQGYIPTVNYQRKLVREILARRTDIDKPKSEQRIPTHEYLEELRSSHSIISPFGWGEICWRDAESWLCGSALIKPDMTHLTTWPEIYIQGETYISLNWDLSNLDEVLDNLLFDSKHYIDIATQGQENYKETLSVAGQLSFAKHFISILS